MNPRAVFGLSAAASLLSAILVAVYLAWPWLRSLDRRQALTWLVAPHMFLRFLGLSFLVPGVVQGSLPADWAVPAAYGDLVAGALAIVATLALVRGATWAYPATWVFNVWGAADFVFAILQGPRVGLEPGMLGAGFYVVTAIVPPLLVSHALIFRLLAGGGRARAA